MSFFDIKKQKIINMSYKTPYCLELTNFKKGYNMNCKYTVATVVKINSIKSGQNSGGLQ